MRFELISIKNFRSSKGLGLTSTVEEHKSWKLIIESYEDLIKYLKVDTSAYAEALLTLNKNSTVSHLKAPREVMLNFAMEAAVMNTPEGKQVWPHDVLIDFIGKKSQSMLKCFQRLGKLMINENGSYSDYKGFLEIWKFDVVDVIIKDSTYFPNDSDAINKSILFLENAERVDIDFYRTISKLYNADCDTIGKIELLKEKDPKYVFQSIKNCEILAIKSEFLSDVQLDNIFSMFENLGFDKKTIIILSSEEGKKRLISHKKYAINDCNHTIIFLD